MRTRMSLRSWRATAPSPPLAQFAPQNLADVRLRQRVEKFDDLRRLVGRHFLAAVRDQVLHRKLGVRRLDDIKFYRLAGLVVGNPDTGAFDDAWTAGGYGFHLVRVDVEPGDDDHVLLAVDDLQKSLGVEHADIAGAEVATGGEGQRVGFRLFPITAH